MAVNIQIRKKQEKRLSKEGYFFIPSSNLWQLNKDVALYVNSVKGLLAPKNQAGFLNTLVYYAENLSASHASNILDRLRHLLKTTNSSSITTSVLINYRSTLTVQTEWYLGTLRGFLKRWYGLGYQGISSEIVELLDSWSLKGNEKGDVVKRLDPNYGPLSDLELQGFNEKAVQAFEQKKITLSDLALALCQSHTGRRPIQISHLKIKDVLEGRNKKGDPAFFLNVPRAKQRGGGFRREFKQFAITKDLWAILNAHANAVGSKAKEFLTFPVDQRDVLELPLFLCFTSLAIVSSPEELQEFLETDKLHIKSEVVTDTVRKIAEITDLHSERTGKPIKISANRFRYTMGTRAAREGFGEMVIAELLDHSDTQNAGVYIQNIPEHVEKLDQAVGQYLAPYAQAFAGVLVDSEKDAIRGNDISSRIRDNDKNLGTCGNHGFCGANAPVPCYTCIHFQPWVDGPHQLVYDNLISERQRLQEVTGDNQIAAINDRTILAVADVIQRCEKRKKELESGTDISLQTQS